VDQEISHGRDITWTLRDKGAPEHIRQEWVGTSWIVEDVATGTRDGKPFNANHLHLTSLRTTREGFVQLARNRWSIEGWYWIRDTNSMRTPIATEAMAQASWDVSERRR
jgi:hypothetical protein